MASTTIREINMGRPQGGTQEVLRRLNALEQGVLVLLAGDHSAPLKLQLDPQS